MTTVTTEQIDLAVPPVATDEATYEAGQPRRDGMNAALKALRTDVVALEQSVDTAELKLAGVADGATANASDASLLARTNHTGTQTAATISDFAAAVAATAAVEANTAKVTNATHTGDVTGATVLTIANDAVTNAKAANMATATIKGRATAGTGDPEDLSPAQVRTLLNVADGATANTGTVTSVGMSVPTGLAVTGGPVTGSGTLAVALAEGYVIPTVAAMDDTLKGSQAITVSPKATPIVPADTFFGGNSEAAGRPVTFTVEQVRAAVAPHPYRIGASHCLTTICIGNSIAAAQKYEVAAAYQNSITSEIHIANALSGSPLQFRRMTASTRADKYGVYGYSGAQLSTINADIEAQLLAPLAAAGITPDLVIGLSLTENDMGNGVASSVTIDGVDKFISQMKARYPAARILLCTPRPSFSYNTPDRVLAYQIVRDYMLSLHDGYKVFVARLDGYENPGSPGTPLGTSASPIYTDSSVHPNGAGAMVNARSIAPIFQEIAMSFGPSYPISSANLILAGSVAATGTNVTGTVPAGVTLAGTPNGTYVALAEDPGLLLTATANPAAGGADMYMQQLPSIAIAGAATTQICPFIEFEIVSGAENLRWINVRPRIYATSGNVTSNFVTIATNDAAPQLQNGDVFLWRVPPRMVADYSAASLTGDFVSMTMGIDIRPIAAGGAVQIRIKQYGVGTLVS